MPYASADNNRRTSVDRGGLWLSFEPLVDAIEPVFEAHERRRHHGRLRLSKKEGQNGFGKKATAVQAFSCSAIQAPRTPDSTIE